MRQVFIAEDGTTFEDAHECQIYETMAGIRGSVEKWAATRYGDKKGQTTSAANKVMKWEMDREAVLGGTFAFTTPATPEEPAIPEAA